MKKLCKLYTNSTFNLASYWFPTRYGMYSLCSKACTNPTQTLHGNPTQTPTKNLHRTLHRTLHTNPTFCFLNMNNENGASVLFVVRVCQNAHFGFTLEGASEWLRCKALRMRAQGVYWSTWPSLNPIATKQIGYYDTPPPKFFHTQGPFSVLTLLAFGDEMYYICTEIWEEPRLPPFFGTLGMSVV